VEQASVVLFGFAFVLYVGATVLYAYQFLLRRPKAAWWATFLTGAGFLCQTLSIGANSMAADGTPLTGPNQLVLASWALVLLYFVMEHIIRIKVYGAFLVPVAAVLMFVATLMGGGEGTISPTEAELLDSWLIGFHVALIVFANAGFAFGAVSAMLYLIQDWSLKNRKTNIFTRRLPSLATLHMIARRSIALAFPVYTAGLSLGIIRAIQADVSAWWADPRIILAGIVWATFGVYLLLVYRHEISTRTACWIAIAGFVFVVVLAILARTLPAGFHIFGL
jgi:ABC-type transport system involved in cytochrome c biogenesis permease subunit